ncbi:MAG: hypothetical protein AMJ62_06405 [Myxococcales bacterium SG8_38]|nr:MAG: hypothetical protein AMJ62_06405 [Myxococcales bacterium SG8_38]
MSTDVGVGELVEELEQRGARLPFEIGAFLALEACEGLLRQSVKLDPDDVRVTPEGSVLVAATAARAEPEEAARSLMSILGRLLVAAGPGVPPDLLQLVKESSTGQRSWALRDLHDVIEASLIPINRAASRRVLARLVRDSDRPAAAKAPELDPHELDAELDELLRDPAARTPGPEQASLALEDARGSDAKDAEDVRAVQHLKYADDEPITERIRFPKPPDARIKPEAPPASAASAAALAVSEDEPEAPPEPVTKTIRKWNTPAESEPETAAVAVAVSIPVTEPELQTPTESVFGTGSVTASVRDSAVSRAPSTHTPEPSHDRPSVTPARRPRPRSGWGIWLFAAAVGLAVYAGIAAGTFDAWFRAPAPVAEAAPSGVIDVRVFPADAQIFVFVGRGPTVSQGMSVAGPHEFVVFDKGLRPTRASIPKDAKWAPTPNGPLYELAIQAQPATVPSYALDLGTPETQAPGGGGAEGTIRVITNPPGSKVYRFVGRGPTARVEVPSIHEGQEVLVYHPGYETRRAVIGPSDWQPVEAEGLHAASLEVELPALPGSVVLEPMEQ